MRTKSGGCCLLHNKFHYFGLIPVYSPECLMYRPGPVARLASKPANWLDIGQSIFLDGKNPAIFSKEPKERLKLWIWSLELTENTQHLKLELLSHEESTKALRMDHSCMKPAPCWQEALRYLLDKRTGAHGLYCSETVKNEKWWGTENWRSNTSIINFTFVPNNVILHLLPC